MAKQAPVGSAATVAVDSGPVAAAAAAASAAPSPPKAICPACGKGTPVGFAFCQHCGQRLQASAGATAAPMRNSPQPVAVAPASGPQSTPAPPAPMGAQTMGVASTMAGGVTPTPPAGMPRNLPAPAARAPVQSSAPPPSTSGGNGANEAFAQTMAPSPVNLEALARATSPRASSAPLSTQPDMPAVAATLETAAPTHGTLVAVNRDGSDGRTIEISAEAFDIGRTEGSLQFADDPYLAPRHVRLVAQNGKVVLRPLDNINGAFVRVQSCELSPGDSFLVGKELLRYEPLAPEERDPPSLVEHGVRFFGSSPREAWGRLRQLTVAGTTRDVWHLTRPELVLGREEGDVTFPDDEFMSRRHAAVKRVGSKARLEDLGSSNGTFVRVRGDRELKAGDLLRVGDQLLRFEP
jgi:pSer/pThr/pTyr-binding forkhead associated (FHA) protein